jgi:hypothetical protein
MSDSGVTVEVIHGGAACLLRMRPIWDVKRKQREVTERFAPSGRLAAPLHSRWMFGENIPIALIDPIGQFSVSVIACKLT